MSYTILLLDRDPALRESRGRLLRQAGFTVLEAAGDDDALRLATECHPGLVLVDDPALAQRLAADPATASLPVFPFRGEERGNQQCYRWLYDANIIGIITTDEERILDANDVFLDMVGYTRAELLSGRMRWVDMLPEESRAASERALEQLAETGSAPPFEKEYFRKDGSRVPVLIGITTLRQFPPQRLCFVLDLSERKQLERRVLEKEKLESIGLLAGGIAHEFNNLLTVILGNASLALAGKPNRSTHYVAAIHAAGERLAELTRQLLASAGKGQFRIGEVDLSKLVTGSLDLLRISAPRSIDFRLELARDLPAIRADSGQLQQLLMNLILNAGEAIGPTSGEIVLRTAAAGNNVLLQVADSGSGMTGEVKERLFDPFFSTKSTGRGLGLAAVAGIVRACGGTIEVDSTPGGGTTFSIFFPAAPLPAEPAPIRSGPATILVADDETYVREFMALALTKRGYRVLSAGDGRHALELLEAHPEVELLLADVVMPVMAGDELVRAARASRPSLKVLLTSAWSREEVRRLCASAHGQIDFLQKPYSADRLVAKIAAMLKAKGD